MGFLTTRRTVYFVAQHLYIECVPLTGQNRLSCPRRMMPYSSKFPSLYLFPNSSDVLEVCQIKHSDSIHLGSHRGQIQGVREQSHGDLECPQHLCPGRRLGEIFEADFRSEITLNSFQGSLCALRTLFNIKSFLAWVERCSIKIWCNICQLIQQHIKLSKKVLRKGLPFVSPGN